MLTAVLDKQTLRNLLGKIFRKEKPRVYLGTLAVVPQRYDLSAFINNTINFQKSGLDEKLQEALEELFSLPLISERTSPRAGDLAMDVFVSEYQRGGVLDMHVAELPTPLFWRPKVTVAARLYDIDKNYTKYTCTVTKKIEWRTFFYRALSAGALLGLKPYFSSKDIEQIFYKASVELLGKVINRA